MRCLLGQLGANGDCLYATVLARQIKHDHPDSHLTWAISSQCRHLLDSNPHVDEIWEWKIDDWSGHVSAWYAFERSLLRMQQAERCFDRIYLSQIIPGNIRHYDGTIRPSILRAYGSDITVPIESVIELTEHELQRVVDFAASNRLENYRHRILFECSSKSGQSYVTPAFAIDVARRVSKTLPQCCFILSTHECIGSPQRNVISAKSLTMRENAALTRHCTMFVGCGSGLTVVATSSAAKDLPNIQLLKAGKSVYASFHHDFLYFGKPADRFIEMADASAERVANAVISCCEDGLAAARTEFHRPLEVFFDDYLERVEKWGVRTGRYIDALESLNVTVNRYGWTDDLLAFGKGRLVQLLPRDPLMMDPLVAGKARRMLDGLLATA
jgi:hypothetical protein